jgi:hypothetical protein
MTTPLQKTLRRELEIKGRTFIVALSPAGLKLTQKGRRKGLELSWDALVSGDAALAVALNASVGQFATGRATDAVEDTSPSPKKPSPTKKRRSRRNGATRRGPR